MAGTESLEEPVLKIRLLVDKKKNKVVLAQVGKDFVDVLFSFLALPMGTIVRLVEKYRQNQKSQATKIGCFSNLYESVGNMDTDDFLTEACKHALLYTRSVKESQCRQLKINIDDNEVLKFYRCSRSGPYEGSKISHKYSNFCSVRCSCGTLLNVEFDGKVGNYELFVSNINSFIVTNNMEVNPASLSLTLKTIRRLGYADADELHEILVDVNHEKVLSLLECVFSSDTPLTDVFLRNQSSYVITKIENMPSLKKQNVSPENSNDVLSITVFVSKLDMKVLYAESNGDFVDLLFTFLAFPLESVWELYVSNDLLGCIGNLCKSIKRLSGETNQDTYKCMLHWYYSVQKPLIDVCYRENCKEATLLKYFNYSTLEPIHPSGSDVSDSRRSGGFVKEERMYVISDDLTIKPINSSSTFSMLKKLETDLDDIEEHLIKISRAVAVRLLTASLMTSNALTTALGCFIPKKLKEEKL